MLINLVFYPGLPHTLSTFTISGAGFPGDPTQAISYTAALEASETKTEQWMTTLQLLEEVIEGGVGLAFFIIFNYC